jgi:lipoprotein NlpD
VSSSSANLGNIQWLTPTQGKIVLPYSVAAKGVDIEGREGQAIVAAAAGKVAYSGSGLKGYGNLIIIKHADNYLTAYSHNKVNLVKEGDSVKRGQKIAELGKTDSDRPLLHFEIRKSGKPINPTSIFNKPAE